MGKSVLTEYQMETFLHKINPNAPYLAKIFLREGAKENIRGDIAFAQSLKETGYFRYGGVVLPEYNNFAGIGAIDPNQKGKAARFATPEEGIRAQIQHLKAYATTEPLNEERVDPRFHLVQRGSAPNLEDLNGKWAVPGTTYGQDIMRIFGEMEKEISNNNLIKLQERLREKRKVKDLLLEKTKREILLENLQQLRSRK